MSVISERLVRARKPYLCADCNLTIEPGQRYRRLYGSAEPVDPKYVIRLHAECPTKEGA